MGNNEGDMTELEGTFSRTLRRTKIHWSDISDVPPRQSRDVQLPS